LLAFSLGAAIAGLTGTLFAGFNTAVFSTSFDATLLITIYAMVILGGAGSIVGVALGAVVINVSLEVLRTPDHARWILYAVILLTLFAKLRPWRRLASVLAATAAFGVALHAIVGAAWPRGVHGPVSVGSGGEFGHAGWIGWTLRHWLVLPKNTYELGQYTTFNYLFVLLIGLVLALTVLRGWARLALLVPTLWLASLVWETRLIEEGSGPTRILLLGAMLVVLMAARPEGLFGTHRVEIV
jgi:hypothetical protein